MMTNEIDIPIKKLTLKGNLTLPQGASMLIIFSHGSGSSRFSKRNNHVASIFNENNMATLLIDLLTTEEDKIYENRFNIELLTSRLIEVTKFIKKSPDLINYNIGYFGASTGAASAIKAAAQLKKAICAIVSRGGRPDLADSDLKFVKAPTLLIVGSLDDVVIELNEQAINQLKCVKELIIVIGASHLFEEPGKLDEVARLATEWFLKYGN
jgi:putative phosphoribosyl transferase